MTNIKITYLHQYFTLPTQSGGTRSYEFARRWIANGKQVHIITSSYRLPEEYRTVKEVTQTTIENIPITIIPTNYSQNLSYNQRIQAFIRFALTAAREAAKQDADVIYATSTPLTIAIPGIIGKFRQGVPLVTEIRDLWPDIPIAMGALNNPVFRQLAYALEWSAYRASSHLVALSPHMADGIKRRVGDSKPITIVPNSSDIEFFSDTGATGQSTRDKLGIGDRPLVVYTGSFGFVNGLSYLVELAAHLQDVDPSICFLLVGEGVEKDLVTQLATERGVLNKSLWIWEPVPKSEIPDILAAASVATSTVIDNKALWNNSANKFFDALAAGRPVMINHGGWLADLINDHQAGVVLSPSSTLEAAHQLADYINNPDGIIAAGKNASRLAHEKFNRDDLSKQVEHVLESVVTKKI